MRRFFSNQLVETMLITASMIAFLFVPESLVPRLIWPLSVGIIFLLIYAFQQTRQHAYFEEDLAALLGGTIFLVTGITLLFNRSAFLRGLGLGLGASVVVGAVWAAWKAPSRS